MARLGKGGGGEVWEARDRVTGATVALKVLSDDAGEGETLALVREAVTLSGLEGLGVPRVLGFGSLPKSKRRYLVRELVAGRSLEELMADGHADWLRPLACAADQLTVLHRAGLLHGDIKPANIIAGAGGSGTLVDLGLSIPWREAGGTARGLTPRFAAPELLAGGPLTVRGEVYALGATLSDLLATSDHRLDAGVKRELSAIAARATREEPSDRYPSVDELASAIKAKAKLEIHVFDHTLAWPVLGLDADSKALAGEVAILDPGEVLAVVGPRRAGRTTLIRRLSWSLGVRGAPVANVEPVDASRSALSSRELIELELDAWAAENGKPTAGLVIVVDDLAGLDDGARNVLRTAARDGARLVVVGSPDLAGTLTTKAVRTFDLSPLDASSAQELVKLAIPSLPNRLVPHLLERVERRPGRLRSVVERLAGRPVTSAAEIDEVLDPPSGEAAPTSARSGPEARAELERALETGRFDLASSILDGLGEPTGAEEAVSFAVARARILLARGDTTAAAAGLDAATPKTTSPDYRAWLVMRARAFTRAGDFTHAAEFAERAVTAPGAPRDALTADALAVRGVALAYLGDEANADSALAEAVATAKQVQNARILAVALGSLAIAHQRAGRAPKAREAYEEALVAAETAHDAWTIATTRLNLAGLAKADGDLGSALVHLEGTVDMARRAGALLLVQQALFNLANVDLYLGRYARASASIDNIASLRDTLSPSARAQLLGLQAELATRTGNIERGARLYELTAHAYDAVQRPLDAAECRLEGLLTRLGGAANDREHALGGAEVSALERELEAVRNGLGDGGFGEHEALAGIVRGSLALARGDEAVARATLDEAYERATKAGHREWAWRALDARARLASAQGSSALARRDTDAALAMLEEMAVKLPRDLREVFWNDPRRNALRQAQTATHLAPSEPLKRLPPGIAELGSRVTRTSILGGPLPAEDRLARIFEITKELASEHDLGRLLQRITDHAVGLLGAERGLIVLVGSDGKVTAQTARDHKGEEAAHHFSRSVADRVIADGEPVLATSARDDERLAQAVSVHKLMIQSIACVPIRGAYPAGTTIGALYVETRLRPGVRFKDELPTLSAFADQAAIAIENARLLEENRKRADELAITNQELEAAKEKLAGLLGRRTEQLQVARRDLKQARAELQGHFGYAGLVGTSAAMRKLYAVIERVKDTDVPVLVTGESGTGKEVVARAVHSAGTRRKAPFIGVNCGAIPENLLESELFGHVRGAFTGADRDRKGLFREASDGTLLLDEIGEMPLKMQAGLLRVLQEKRVRPVGGTNEEPCNARVIAATNRSLSRMVEDGTFREDLFYRLHVVELRIPPLRERADDIPALVDHFLGLFAARHKRERKTIARDAIRKLTAFEWPGNVRQLEHVLLTAWLLSEETEIGADDLDLPAPSGHSHALASSPPASTSSLSSTSSRQPNGTTSTSSTTSGVRVRSKEDFRDVEKEKIIGALTRCNWNRVKAAEMVGLPRRTFYRRLKEYGIL